MNDFPCALIVDFDSNEEFRNTLFRLIIENTHHPSFPLDLYCHAFPEYPEDAIRTGSEAAQMFKDCKHSSLNLGPGFLRILTEPFAAYGGGLGERALVEIKHFGMKMPIDEYFLKTRNMVSPNANRLAYIIDIGVAYEQSAYVCNRDALGAVGVRSHLPKYMYMASDGL